MRANRRRHSLGGPLIRMYTASRSAKSQRLVAIAYEEMMRVLSEEEAIKVFVDVAGE